jgi:hypothetical protein
VERRNAVKLLAATSSGGGTHMYDVSSVIAVLAGAAQLGRGASIGSSGS